MQIDVRVTRSELLASDLTEDELKQMILTDLITGDIDSEYPEFEVNVFIV